MTLKQVAELSGVSRATASRALNGDPRVRDQTRARVLEAAEALGYRANHAARSLAGGRTGILGLVLPTDRLLDDPYGSHVVHAVAAAANAADHQLLLWLTRRSPSGSAAAAFRSGIVDGVVVASSALGDEWVEELVDGPLPTVLVGRDPTRADVDTVAVDDEGGARSAVEHLIGLGHRRIATITGRGDRADAAARRRGYEAALAENEMTPDPRLVAAGDYSSDGGVAAMVRLLRHEPTAVFAGNDLMATGAYRAIELAGLRVPDDVSVVGFDGFPLAPEPDPALTTVRQDLDEVGRLAVETLLHRITDPAGPTASITVDVELLPGASTAPPPTV